MDLTDFGSETSPVLLGFKGVKVAQAMWDYRVISLLPQTELSKLVQTESRYRTKSYYRKTGKCLWGIKVCKSVVKLFQCLVTYYLHKDDHSIPSFLILMQDHFTDVKQSFKLSLM